MIRPTRTFLLGLLAGLPIALLTVFYEPMWMIWVSYVGVWCLLGGLDVLLAPGKKQLELELAAPSLMHLGEPTQVELGVRTGSKSRAKIELLLEAHGPVDEPDTHVVALEAGEGKCAVDLEPQRRGELEFERVFARWTGPLKLFAQVKSVEVEKRTAVAPNIAAVRRAAIHMASHNAMMQGAKLLRFIGDGTEFESLREYTPGLNIRDVHWGATARHRKLLCRENRSERNHRVIIALDTGALMREPLDGMPRLDHAINAGLLLGFLSLKMGDQVGMFGFDAEVRSYLAPQPGIHNMKRLLKQSASLKYSPLETNFTLAMSTLRAQLRRRAIIVVFTDFMDSVSAELMVENLGLMSKKHVVLFVAIRDASLDRICAQRPGSLHDLNRAVVAGNMRREREVVLTRLRRQGIFCIDGAPEEISVDLINRYLDVHRRELV